MIESGGRAWTRGLRASAPVVAALAIAALYAHHVARWNFLGDDAFISFRYARHLAEGHGLTWNPGERVEGYTNFLWVLLLAGGMGLGIDPETLSRGLGIASGSAVLVLVGWFAARRFGARTVLAFLPPALLASNRSFAAWSTGGLETMFFTLLVSAGLIAFLVERERNVTWSFASPLLLAAATLTRPDGALFVLPLGMLFLVDVARGTRSFRTALLWVAPYALIVGVHLAWRHAYHGFWVPNTFYAKVPGLRWERGLRYLSLFHEDYGILWMLPLGVLALALRRDALPWVLSGTIALQVVYLAAVGGDRFEFRLLVSVLPALYLWLADGAHLLAGIALRGRLGRWGPSAAACLLAALLLGMTHAGSVRPEARAERFEVASVEGVAFYGRHRARQGKLLRAWIRRGLLPRDVILATGGAGAVPYYTDWTTVDYRGLNDIVVAHTPIDRIGQVAHERRAPLAYLRKRRVEIFDVTRLNLVPRKLHKKYLRPWRYDKFKGKLRVLKIGRRYLVFATFLSKREFRRRFGHLDVVR